MDPETKPRGLTMEPEPPTTILTSVVRREAAVLDFIWWATGGQQRLLREGSTQSDLCFGTRTPEVTGDV